jgi:hypothetical protein
MHGADTAPPRCSSPSRKSRTAWSGSGRGAAYHAPIPTLGDSVDLAAGYANVNSGTVQNLFDISGSGRTYAGRYNFGLPRVANVDQKLSLGYDVRYYDNSVVPVGAGTTIVPDYVRGLLAFYDYGRVWFNNPQPFEQSVTGISSGPGAARRVQGERELPSRLRVHRAEGHADEGCSDGDWTNDRKARMVRISLVQHCRRTAARRV